MQGIGGRERYTAWQTSIRTYLTLLLEEEGVDAVAHEDSKDHHDQEDDPNHQEDNVASLQPVVDWVWVVGSLQSPVAYRETINVFHISWMERQREERKKEKRKKKKKRKALLL